MAQSRHKISRTALHDLHDTCRCFVTSKIEAKQLLLWWASRALGHVLPAIAAFQALWFDWKATNQMLLAAISNASHQLEWSQITLDVSKSQIHTNRPGLTWIGKLVEPRCLKSMYCWKSMLPFFPPLPPVYLDQSWGKINTAMQSGHVPTSPLRQKAIYYELAYSVFLWIILIAKCHHYLTVLFHHYYYIIFPTSWYIHHRPRDIQGSM